LHFAFLDYYADNRRGADQAFRYTLRARRFECGTTEVFGAADRSNLVSPDPLTRAHLTGCASAFRQTVLLGEVQQLEY